MANVKFNRWDKALKACMTGKKTDDKGKGGNRWNSDPMALNTEAHELPPEKQRIALDFMEEAPPELRAKMAPIWKFCFAQWHIYDACLEAMADKGNVQAAFEEEMLQADVDSLVSLFESGDLDKAATTEKWAWKLLEPFPPAGSLEPWSEEVAKPLVKVGREERKEGVLAFEQERYDKAFWHFWQGLKLIARAPDSATGPHAKLRCDLWKNKSAAALKLKMPRVALEAATAALAIDMRDQKAWFRKSCALEELGQAQEAKAAMAKAGLAAAAEEAKAQEGAARALVTGQPQEPLVVVEEDELEPPLHKTLESLLFVEIGVDSISAVDLIRHVQAELKTTPIPLTIIFDHPKVYDAVTMLLSHINAADELYYRRKMNSTVWRALCHTLGRDPVQDSLQGRLGLTDCPEYAEDKALAVLGELKEAYEDSAWVQKTHELAKRVAFEQRSFLVGLRPKALEVQRPILEKHGLDPDSDGLRSLELGLVRAAAASQRVADALQSVRVALQGGPNGIWAVNMDAEAGFWDDSCSMESRIQYTKMDPFGPRRVNTNSVYGIPRPI
mmetsp:Transcript_41715/g.120892  ORF Transcript_41715/g.120892 Transcript_41715/m.120892 type:complete len:557 (-) Transcript_41715:73-1743(-)